MKKILLFLAAVTVFYSCSTNKKITDNSSTKTSVENMTKSEGTSFDNAIVIKENTETKGVEAEYAWIRKHYPGSKTKGQSLLNHNGRNYDKIVIITSDGSQKEMYFDISNFFGKF